MEFDHQAKEMVRNLLGHFERLMLENTAYFSVIECIEIPGLRDQLRSAFQDVVQSPEAVAEIHAKFAPLYERISHAIDEGAALAVLQSIPVPKSKAN
jgi:hypothetical protein